MNSGPRTDDIIIVAGSGLVSAGAVPDVREVAERTDIGVLNTWAAKGLFPWNHPAHLGTMGLQAGDIGLAGLASAHEVVLCGVTDDELSRAELTSLGVRWLDVNPGDLAAQPWPVRAVPTPRPALYTELFDVCQPMFADDTLPLNPARAASDLAAVLPEGSVVCGDACRSGFWLGRTFPTRTLGSIRLPTRPVAGFAATQALVSRRTGHFSLAVVDGIDDATRSVLDRATDLVLEVWIDAATDHAPTARSAAARTADLLAAHAAGGVHVLALAVRFSEINRLIAVAGAPRWHA